MRIYLVRHGQAKSEDVDSERHLTDEGARVVERIAADAVEQLGVRPVRLFHSGKARARQTAEIWAGLTGADPAEADGLSPNDDPSIWFGRLQPDGDDVMLVGHLPHLERLAGMLVAGDPDATVAEFPAGGLVVLEHTNAEWAVTARRL